MGKRLSQLWENYREFADERAWLVATLLKQFTSIGGKNVLDFGCGNGGTARFLSRVGARVTAVDTKPELELFFIDSNIKFFNASNVQSYFKARSYDIVILQDVLEHVPDPEQLIKQVRTSLCPGGWIYISTPNRFSLWNAISDPHWNLPGVALFPRNVVAFLVKNVFRRDRRQRTDWAALLSLKKIKSILKSNNFKTIFVNTKVAKILFQKPQAVVCHPKHIQLVQWMHKKNFDRLVYRIVNDRLGFFNYFINPTWYIIGQAR